MNGPSARSTTRPSGASLVQATCRAKFFTCSCEEPGLAFIAHHVHVSGCVGGDRDEEAVSPVPACSLPVGRLRRQPGTIEVTAASEGRVAGHFHLTANARSVFTQQYIEDVLTAGLMPPLPEMET